LTITSHPQIQVIHITNQRAASPAAHRHQPQQQWPRKLPRVNAVNGVVIGTKSRFLAKDQENGMRRTVSTSKNLHQMRTKLGWMISTIIDHLRLFVFPLRIKSLEGEVPPKDPGRIIIMDNLFQPR